MKRRRSKQVAALDQRIAEHARRLRKEVKSLPLGLEREKQIHRARQAETASDVSSSRAQELLLRRARQAETAAHIDHGVAGTATSQVAGRCARRSQLMSLEQS